MIYKQKTSGPCTVFATAASINKVMWQDIPQEDIEAFYDKHAGVKDGMRFPEVFDAMDQDPLGGFKVESWDCIYDSGLKTVKGKEKNKKLLAEMHTALKEGEGLVMGIFGNKVKPFMPLKEFWMLPLTKDGGPHALCITEQVYGPNRRVIGWKVQNSSGEKFGDKGFCYIKSDLLSQVARQVYRVKFRKA